MINLNLIPPNKKKELRLTQLYITIKDFVIAVLLINILAAITLLGAKISLQNHFNRIVDQTTLTTKYANTLSQDVRKFNTDLNAAAKVQANYLIWSKFLNDFSLLVPENLVLDNITINGNKILLTGFAENRESLLAFQSNLENSTMFDQIDIPIDNLLTRNDIDFNIKADINLEEVRKYAD